jgi:hypothetical protein
MKGRFNIYIKYIKHTQFNSAIINAHCIEVTFKVYLHDSFDLAILLSTILTPTAISMKILYIGYYMKVDKMVGIPAC